MLLPMSRPRSEPSAPSSLAPALLRHLRARGVDPAPLSARFGLSALDVEEDEVLVSPSALTELLEAVADALGEPFLGLRLPTELSLRTYGFAELAARSSATAGEALERVARYAALVHPDLEATLEVDPVEARWVETTPRRPRDASRHVQEYGLAYALTLLRLGGCEPSIRRVWFAHARPPDIAPLESFFRTEDLSFGREDSGIAFEAALVATPMKSWDPRLLATVDALAEESLRGQARGRSFAGIVGARLPALLPDRATLEGAAEALHMSARTMQRRLDEEGTRFSLVLDGVREELARTWLAEDSIPLGEVSQRLGFSELATFSRAFKRWTGKPPGLWRRSR
jgi:AraC-like DNA-binding protein